MYKRKRLAFLCLGMVFAFLVNSVPGYAAEGIDSLPVAGTVSIDNSVPADPSSISEAAFVLTCRTVGHPHQKASLLQYPQIFRTKPNRMT